MPLKARKNDVRLTVRKKRERKKRSIREWEIKIKKKKKVEEKQKEEGRNWMKDFCSEEEINE